MDGAQQGAERCAFGLGPFLGVPDLVFDPGRSAAVRAHGSAARGSASSAMPRTGGGQGASTRPRPVSSVAERSDEPDRICLLKVHPSERRLVGVPGRLVLGAELAHGFWWAWPCRAAAHAVHRIRRRRP
jgi:hypothetical protein